MHRIPAACGLMTVISIWAPRGTAAYSIPADDDPFFLPRSDGCSADFFPCAGSNLPDNFCCPDGSTCDVLAGNTTILCCPLGDTCSVIRPISCDLSQQDVNAFPDASIKTTALNGVLTHCGSGTCCPFGYSCNSSGDCAKDADQNTAPTTTSPPTSAATTPATTTSSSSSGSGSESTVAVVPTTETSPTISATGTTSAGTAAGSESAVAGAGGKSFPTASVVGGVVGGLGGLLLIGAAVWAFMSHRLRRKEQLNNGMPGSSTYKPSRLGSSFGNIINHPLSISSPKLQGDTAYRTDFIRKRSVSPLSHSIEAGSDGGRRMATPVVGSAGNYKPHTPPLGGGGTVAQDAVAVPPIRNMRGSISRQQQQQWNQRVPSMEEINVGADPSIVAYGGFRENSLLPPPLEPPPALTTASGSFRSQRQGRDDRQTTFSDMMAAVDLNLDRFVPNSVQSSPTRRR